MKLKFKHQPFQEDAARAVCAVFEGQQILAGQAKYLMDVGGDTKNAAQGMLNVFDADGWKNAPVQPEIRAHLLLTLTLAGGKWYINIKKFLAFVR